MIQRMGSSLEFQGTGCFKEVHNKFCEIEGDDELEEKKIIIKTDFQLIN